MPGEECRGLGTALSFIDRTTLSGAIRRMTQRRATDVRHPLASEASSTPPKLPLGDETLRNYEELPLGDETPETKGRASPAGERGVIDAATASLGGRNPEEQPTGECSNIGRPHLPLGDETSRNNLMESAAPSTPSQLPLGDETPRTKEEL